MALHEGSVELSRQRVIIRYDLVKTNAPEVRWKFGGPSGRKSESNLRSNTNSIISKIGELKLTS